MYRIDEVDGRYYAMKQLFGVWLPLHLQSKATYDECLDFIALR